MAVKIKNNIFAETGVKEPAVAMLKSQMVQTILDIFQRRGYKQKDAAEILNVQQPVISDLANGKLHKFTIDRLLGFLIHLGWNVKVETSKQSKTKAASVVYKQSLAG